MARKAEKTVSFQMTLDFRDAPPQMLRQAAEFAMAADSAKITMQQEGGEDTTWFPHETCEIRRKINRYVCTAAHSRGVSLPGMWIILYHHIARTLGRHPVAESHRLGLATHLEALMRIPAGPETAMEYLCTQIEKYGTGDE